MLDGDAFEVKGIGFAGVKGFGGGFGARALGPWGEAAIKRSFTRPSTRPQAGVGPGAAAWRSGMALLHYSPIRATVEGEPPEIFPFLGSTASKNR